MNIPGLCVENALEVFDSGQQTVPKRDSRLPIELKPRELDIGLPLPRIVGWQWQVHDFALALRDQRQHQLRELHHGEFAGVTQIDRADEAGLVFHHADHAFDEIADVLKATGLLARAEHGDVFVLQRLNDEIGDYAPVIRVHVGAVRVEDTDDTNIDLVLPVVVKKQGFGGALALVVTGANADRINSPPVGFRLRMNLGVSVHFAGAGLQDARTGPLG